MLGLSAGLLFSGIVLGAVGLMLFLWGKREGEPATLVSGLLLSALPMGVHSVGLLWLLSGAVLGGLAWFRRSAGAGKPVA